MKIYCMKSEHLIAADQVGFGEIIPHFCKESTVHGLQHVGKTSGYIKLTSWLLLVIACTAGLIYNAYTITSSYLDYLVYVKIDVHDSKELAFPAVTICNTNPVKRSELYLSPRMEALVASWQNEGGGAKRRRKRATCPNTVEPVSGVCFWREDTGRISQADARQHCLDIGATLAIVDTQEKFTHIFQSPLQLASTQSVWLDLKYSDITGTWQWAESVDLDWSNWMTDPGSPPSDTDKTCVYVSYETDQLTWKNVECDGVHKFGIVFGLRPLCMDGTSEAVETTTEAAETTTIAQTTTEDITTTVEETSTIEPSTAAVTTQQESTIYVQITTIETTSTQTTTTIETTSTQITTSDSTVGETTQVDATTTSIPDITTTDGLTTSPSTTPDITTPEPTVPDTSTERTSTLFTSSLEPTSSGTAELLLNADGKVLREDFKKEGDLMRVLSEITDEEKKLLGYKYPEFVLECSFNGQVCTQEDFQPFFDAVHGSCYVFNSGWNQSKSLYTASISGRQRGLHLLMNIGQHEYITSVGKQAGAVAVVHDQSRMPFPEDEGILAVPGHVTSVGIKKVSVERLGDQYSDCLTDIASAKQTRYTELYGVNYTVSACEKSCYQDQVIQRCACADPQYPTTGTNGIPACDVRNKTQGDCVNALVLLYIEDQLNCSCPLPCSALMYTYKVSKTMWPSDVEMDAVLSSYSDQLSPIAESTPLEETVRRNLLRLEVYFEELNFKTLKETPKYPFARYISGLGAIVGLWLGCSVLSMLEILEVLTDALYLACNKLVVRMNLKQNIENTDTIASPTINRKKVSPLDLCDAEIGPDTDQASTSIYHNPAFQGGQTQQRGRRIRNRRRSTLDNIFSVARQNVSHFYEVNHRLIPHGRDEGYSSEEGSPLPGMAFTGTATTTLTHVAQLHIPNITLESPPCGQIEKQQQHQKQQPSRLMVSRPKARHEHFLFGSSS